MPPDNSPDARGATSARLLNQRYELAEKVGEGNFFSVYRARDTQTGRPVAIKILNEEYSTDREFADRLRTEELAAVKLDHPHIVPVLDAWIEDGRVAVATEFVRGINLKDRIRRVAPFPLAVAIDIAAAVAEALEYAASLGFSHGDLRPENILVTPEGQVKLADYGVGAAVAASSRLQMSALLQTAHYLPPEVAGGKPPSSPSDVYSLGAILFEMLSGEPPFQADTPFAVAVKHLHDPPPSLRRLNPGVPKAVEGIVLKCLQKDPAARYPSPAGLLTDLRGVREALRYGKPLTWSPSPEPAASGGARAAAAPPAAPRPASSTPPPASKAQRPAPAPRPAREAAAGEPSTRLLLILPLMALLMVAAGFAVFVWGTQAPRDATVPHLTGLTRSAAEQRLKERGLTLRVTREMFDEKPAGTVLLQDPPGANQVKQGKAVDVWISKGPKPATVPGIVEMNETDARNRLREASLSLGSVQHQYDEIVTKGTVISQEPAAGTEVAVKSPVSFVVSRGPEPMPLPEPDTQPEVAPPPPLDGTTTDGTTTDSTATDGTATDDGFGTTTDPSTAPTAADQESAPSERVFDVDTKLEGRKGWSRVRIVVNDDRGRREQINQLFRKGQTVTNTLKAVGAPGSVRITVYVNGKVVKDIRF